MAEFWIALGVFLATHAAPRPLGLRDAAIRRLGRSAWLTLYSALSVASLVWLVTATLRAPYVELWPPSREAALLTIIAMPFACILFVCGAGRPNPASVTFARDEERSRPGVTAITRHPVLWAFAIWGAVHVAANGDLATVTLFGAMTVFALAGMPMLERRARRGGHRLDPLGPPRLRLSRALDGRLLVEVVIGLALYAALLGAHGPVLGVYPLAWL